MDSSSLIKSSNGITSVSLDARLLAKRYIYIDDQEITGELIANVVKKIMILASEEPEKAITIILDSPGGSVKAGMVLYDLLQTFKTPIRVVVAGRAYSMAAVLLAAGKHVFIMRSGNKPVVKQRYDIFNDSCYQEMMRCSSHRKKIKKNE